MSDARDTQETNARPRLTVTLDKSIYAMLLDMAERDGGTVARQAEKLILEAVAAREREGR